MLDSSQRQLQELGKAVRVGIENVNALLGEVKTAEDVLATVQRSLDRCKGHLDSVNEQLYDASLKMQYALRDWLKAGEAIDLPVVERFYEGSVAYKR